MNALPALAVMPRQITSFSSIRSEERTMRDALNPGGRPRSAPVAESLENRQLFALALVHQELHRPPNVLAAPQGTPQGTPPAIVQPTVGLQLTRAGLLDGPVFGFDVYSP